MNPLALLSMKTLALEFSTNYRSAAVGVDGEVIGYCEESPGTIAHPFKLIEQVLENANIDREQIECISIGIGPGSYTGIRIAISIAQGWQLARNVKLLGINSITGLAEKLARNQMEGEFVIAVDAQRGEFYYAVYDIENGNYKCLQETRIIGLDDLRKEAENKILVGTDISKWLPDAIQVIPDAKSIYRLSVNNNEYIQGEKLEPIYLRPISFVKAPPRRILNL